MRLVEIEYLIKPNGEVEIKVKGVKGLECVKLTEPLQSKLGEVTEQTKTSEYYEEPPKETITTQQD